jgi:hypothetical protein
VHLSKAFESVHVRECNQSVRHHNAELEKADEEIKKGVYY